MSNRHPNFVTMLLLLTLLLWSSALGQPPRVDPVPPKGPLEADGHTLLLLRFDREAPYANEVEGAPAIRSFGQDFLVKGPHGHALAVRDWRSRLEVPRDDKLKPGPGGTMTIEFWIRGEFVSHWRPYGIVMQKKGLLRINFYGRNNRIGINGHLQGDGRAACTLAFDFPDEFDWTAWHHVAFVFGVPTGKDRRHGVLLIDGKEVHRAPVRKEPGVSKAPLTLFNGASSRSHRWTRPFAGALDDVRISNVVRYVSTGEDNTP